MSWSAVPVFTVGEILTSTDINKIGGDLSAGFAVGTLKFVIANSGGAATETTWQGGWLECNGASVSRTTYSALDTYLAGLTPARPFGTVDGTHVTLPDLRGGRMPLHVGGNTTVSTLGNSDGVTDANRRGTIHRHTPHTHTTSPQAIAASGSTFAAGGGGGGAAAIVQSADGGSGTNTDPLDGGAYLVAGIWVVKY